MAALPVNSKVVNTDEVLKTALEKNKNDISLVNTDERNAVFTESGVILSSLTGNNDGQELPEYTSRRTVIYDKITVPIDSGSNLNAETEESTRKHLKAFVEEGESTKDLEFTNLPKEIESCYDLVSTELLKENNMPLERIGNNEEITNVCKEDMVSISKEVTVTDIPIEKNIKNSNEENRAYISIKEKDIDKTVITEGKSANELRIKKETEINSLINIDVGLGVAIKSKESKYGVEEKDARANVRASFKIDHYKSDLTSKYSCDDTEYSESNMEGNFNMTLIGNKVLSTELYLISEASTASNDNCHPAYQSKNKEISNLQSHLKPVINPGEITLKDVPKSINNSKDSNYINPSIIIDNITLISDTVLHKGRESDLTVSDTSVNPTGLISKKTTEFKEVEGNFDLKLSDVDDDDVSFPDISLSVVSEVSTIKDDSSNSVTSVGSVNIHSENLSLPIIYCESTKEESSRNSHIDKVIIDNKELVNKIYEISSIEDDIPESVFDKDDIKYDIPVLDSHANSKLMNERIDLTTEFETCTNPVNPNLSFGLSNNSDHLKKDSSKVIPDNVRITFLETSVTFPVTEMPSIKLDEDFQHVNADSSSCNSDKHVSFSADMEDESEISHACNFYKAEDIEKPSFDGKITSIECSPNNVMLLPIITENADAPYKASQKNNIAISRDVLPNIACDYTLGDKLCNLAAKHLNPELKSTGNPCMITERIFKDEEYPQVSILSTPKGIATSSNCVNIEKVVQKGKILTVLETDVSSCDYEILKSKQNISVNTPDLNLVKASISNCKILSKALEPCSSNMIDNSNSESTLKEKLDDDKACDMKKQDFNVVSPNYSKFEDMVSLKSTPTSQGKIQSQHSTIDNGRQSNLLKLENETCLSGFVNSTSHMNMIKNIKVEKQTSNLIARENSVVSNIGTNNDDKFKQAVSSGSFVVDIKSNLKMGKEYFYEENKLSLTPIDDEVDDKTKAKKHSGIDELNVPLLEHLDKDAKLIYENHGFENDTFSFQMDKPCSSLDKSHTKVSAKLKMNESEEIDVGFVSVAEKYDILAENVDVIMEEIEVVSDKSFPDNDKSASINQLSKCVDSETTIASCPDFYSSLIQSKMCALDSVTGTSVSKIADFIIQTHYVKETERDIQEDFESTEHKSINSVTDTCFTHSTKDCNIGLLSGPSDCEIVVQNFVSDIVSKPLRQSIQDASVVTEVYHKDIVVGPTTDNCAVDHFNLKPMLAHCFSSAEAEIIVPFMEKEIVEESASTKEELLKICLPHFKKDAKKSNCISKNVCQDIQVETAANKSCLVESFKDFSLLDIPVQLSNEGPKVFIESSIKDKYVSKKLKDRPISEISHINRSNSGPSISCISNKPIADSNKGKSSEESKFSPIIEGESFSKAISKVDSFSKVPFVNRINLDRPEGKLDSSTHMENFPVCMTAHSGKSAPSEIKALNPEMTLKHTQISSGDDFGTISNCKVIADVTSKMITVCDLEIHTDHGNKSSLVDISVFSALTVSEKNDANEVTNKLTLVSSNASIEDSPDGKNFIDSTDKKLSSVNVLDQHVVSKNMNHLCGEETDPLVMVKTDELFSTSEPLMENTIIKGAHIAKEDDFGATSKCKKFNDSKKLINNSSVMKVESVSCSNTSLPDRSNMAITSLTHAHNSSLPKCSHLSSEVSLVITSQCENCVKNIMRSASKESSKIVIPESQYSNPIRDPDIFTACSTSLSSEVVTTSSITSSNTDSIDISENSGLLNKNNLGIASGNPCNVSVSSIINASSFISENSLFSPVPISHEQTLARSTDISSNAISNSVHKNIVKISDAEPNFVKAIGNTMADISLSTQLITKTQALNFEPLLTSPLADNTIANQSYVSSIMLPLPASKIISEEKESCQVSEVERKDISNLIFLSPVSMTDSDSNNRSLSRESYVKPTESAFVDDVCLIDSNSETQRSNISSTMHNSSLSSTNIIVEYSESSSSDLDDSLECIKYDLSNVGVEKCKVSKNNISQPNITPFIFDDSISSLDLHTVTLSDLSDFNRKALSKSVGNISNVQSLDIKAPNNNILLVDYSESSSDCDTSLEVTLDSSTQDISHENMEEQKKYTDSSNVVKTIFVTPMEKLPNCDDLRHTQHNLNKYETNFYQTDQKLKKELTVCKNSIDTENHALLIGDVNKNESSICKEKLITPQLNAPSELKVHQLEKDLDRIDYLIDDRKLHQHNISLIDNEVCGQRGNMYSLLDSQYKHSERECNLPIKKSELPKQKGIYSHSSSTKSTSSSNLDKGFKQDNSAFIKYDTVFGLCTTGSDICLKEISDSEFSKVKTKRRQSIEQVLDPNKVLNTESMKNENLDEDTCDISLVGVQNFDWDAYLEETNSDSTPPTAFIHVEQSLETGIKDGQFVEVLSNYNLHCENATETISTTDVTTYWPAKVLSSCGLLLRLRYEIVPRVKDINLEFWKDLSIKNDNLKPLGWSQTHKIPLKLPLHLSSSLGFDSCEINIDPLLSVPQETFEHDRCEIFARVNIGTLLEVQDIRCPFEGWVARIIENHGGLLLLELLNSEHCENKVWVFFTDALIKPLHWFKEQGEPYRYKCLDSISIIKDNFDNQPSLSFLHALQPSLNKHNLHVGMHVEAVLPTTSQTIHVASVSKIFNDSHFELDIDGYHWVTTSNDPLIFPINFCKNKGLPLTPPKESTLCNFEWEDFLSYDSYLAVNPEAFSKQTMASDLGFKEGQKLEAVNPLNEGQICKATVKKVIEHLLVIQVSPELSFYRGASSSMLFPVGWSMANQLELYVPHYVQKRKCTSSETCNQELISTTEVKSEDEGLRSESTNQNSLWCDRLYINHCCYAGPYLSKSKIAKLSQSVGPGPVNLVLREVLGRTINAGYVPTRVLKELKGVSCVHPSWRPIALKAKFRRHTLKTSVHIAITARDVDAFLMELSKTLLCCHNLWSFKLSGEICPYDCNGLAFSTVGNVANKGRGGFRGSQARRKRGKKRLLYPMKTTVNAEETERQVDEEEDDDEGEEPCSGSEVEGASRPSSPLLDLQRKLKQKRLLSSLEIHMNEPKIADSSPGHKLRGGIKRRNDGMELRETTFPKEGHPPSSEEENPRKRAKAELKRASNNPYSLEPAKVGSDPLDWSVKDVENYILSQPSICHHAVRLREHEVDGRAFMLLNLPTLVHYLNLPHSSAVTLAQHICKVKLAHFVNFQM